jgi:hypothetical protein
MVLSVKAMTQGSSFTVFSEKGENFTVFVNGDQKNSKPGDHVTVDGIFGPNFKVRIVFRDAAIHEINKTIFNKPGGEIYYVLRPGKKGEFVLEHADSDYIHTGNTVKEESSGTNSGAGAKSSAGKDESTVKKSTGGCKTPMAEGDFQASTAMISNAPFDPIKLSNAKKMVETHCLSCRQIVQVMYILSYEASRLSIAKAAYLHCYDPSNYEEVKNVLNSTKSKDDLDKYIDSVK